MKRRSKQTVTSLWAVVEAMQRRLEGQGLSRDVVDVAVTTRLRSALSQPRPAPARIGFAPLKA